MSSPPKSVRVGPHTYRLIFDQAEIDRASVAQGEAVVGETDPLTLRILVAPKLADTQAMDTVVHELLHALADLLGLATIDGWDARMEERIVRPMATALVALVRQNPALIDWLRS